MEIVNNIKEGLHLDNNVYDQPDMTMRDNLNGVITDIGNGNYKWSNIKGNELSFVIGTTDLYMAHCKIKDRLFILTLNTNATTFKILEVTFSGNIGTTSLILSTSNTELNMSFSFPIRTIWGFYENEDIQRIYWSDFNNPPRCINVENIPISLKFLDYFPIIDKVYGNITKSDITPGGSLKAGTHFFAWRYYTNDGYYTDWSYISNPISVTGGSPGSTIDKYQEYEGMAPDIITSMKATIEISNIDNDYDNIQVCSFYSNDYNIARPGLIFFDGGITSNVMSFNYSGSENFGTVTIDDLILTSVKIDKLKDSVVAKKQNVISCVVEREELDLAEYVEADISVATRSLPLDVAGYPGRLTSFGSSKALFGLTGTINDKASGILRRGQWYKAITEVQWNDGNGVITVPINNLFYVEADSTSTTYISGTFKAVVVTKKYLLHNGVSGGDINTNYRFNYEYLEGEYYDWKSQKVNKTYKSYPHGETIRLGILFFDLTGRPWFVRHLRNTNETYGPGDTLIPKRSPSNPMLTLTEWHEYTQGETVDGYYQNACANLQHLKVGDIDITDIKDKISGFMIVRAPIIHQYNGMGVLVPTYLGEDDESDNIFSLPGLFCSDGNLKNYFTCYDFYCPEDMLNFKGFSIQPGDELENIGYLTPYCKNEGYAIDEGQFLGFGRRESHNNEFYQKLFRETTPATITANGAIGLSHEIISSTKYVFGDTDIQINPVDSTKLYQMYCKAWNDGIDVNYGINGTHNVVILDIDDSAGNIKGPSASLCNYSNPYALLCSTKRPNPDPYGGYSATSLSNTVYVSTGHFQEITPEVLSDIYKDGKYVFNEIDIFGGDTYVSLFDYKRLYIEYDTRLGKSLGHSMIFPVETRINLSMRNGDHIAKTRSYDSTYNTAGLQKRTGFTNLEDFNYNDGYSTDDINDKYLPLPFNYKNTNEYKSRIRYSAEKNIGENRDSFRMFSANDKIDLDSNKGFITNIRSEGDRLIYWQPDELGYIPINERALTQNSIGESIQLGVSGIFERYDKIIGDIGNSHQFGLIDSPVGYHWYDSRRKIFLTLSHNLELNHDSIVKGIDSWIQNNIPDNFEQYDNPFNSYGIYGGYDGKSKTIFNTFKTASGYDTVIINASLNKFVGFSDITAGSYISFRNNLYEITPDLLKAYIHGTNQLYMNFFGTQYNGHVKIVVKEPSNVSKIFDKFEVIGNSNFFTSMLFENSSQSKEETVSEYIGSLCSLLNRDYKFRNKRWYGNFPKASRERLNDGYVLVTFKISEPYLVEFYEMKSIVRNNI